MGSQFNEQRRARILIVDDHDLVRAGLREMLAPEHDLAILGEASDGSQVVDLCRRLAPDLVLRDVRMPALDGVAATQAIKAACPQVHILILTVAGDPEILLAALRAGATA